MENSKYTFSYYQKPISNSIPSEILGIQETYEMIKGKEFKCSTNHLRMMKNHPKIASEIKQKEFNYVTFSGIFSQRKKKSLIKHSGLLTIDFDHAKDLEKLKTDLIADEYFETKLLFRSPSGDGLKWIIPIGNIKGSHEKYFNAISAYIKQNYKIDIDIFQSYKINDPWAHEFTSEIDLSIQCMRVRNNNIF